MSKKSFSALLITTTQFFSIPGTILGIGFSALLLLIAILIISSIISYQIPMYYQWIAVLLTLLIGLLLPSLTNAVPIYRAITSTLRDSLDLYHQVLFFIYYY
jgi:ABC-type antimicrobial peptide transport system permease subunit